MLDADVHAIAAWTLATQAWRDSLANTKPAEPVIVGDYGPGGTDEHMLDADVHAIAAWTLATQAWRESLTNDQAECEGM